MPTLDKIRLRQSKPLRLPVHWKKWLVNLPADYPFFMAVGGESFSGKSSFCLKLGSYLSLNYPVLYLPLEEPVKRSNTISQKLQDMKISKDLLKNVSYEDGIDSITKLDRVLKKGKYKLCVIDSVSVFTGESLTAQNELIKYIENNESVSFIVVLHKQKNDRNIKGSSAWNHSPDIFVWITNDDGKRIAEFRKNRFLGHKQPLKFDLKTETIKKRDSI